VWSFPQELVVVNTLMEAATALGYIPKAEEEEELEDDASQFKSPFKDATKHPRERPAGYLKTRAKFKQEVLQLIGGQMQGAFIAEVIKEKKHPGKILQDWHKTLCGNGLTVAAALLMRAVQGEFPLRRVCFCASRSSSHPRTFEHAH